jgi:hemoglobin
MEFGPDRLPYDELGGALKVDALVQAFYDEMDRNPAFERVRKIHPESLDESREKLRLFLSGWLGGPDLYVQKHGHPRLRMRHARFPIGETERDQWLACMAAAMDHLDIQGDIRAFLDTRFAHTADFLRNQPG